MDVIFWWVGMLVSAWVFLSVVVVIAAMAWELGTSLQRISLPRFRMKSSVVTGGVTVQIT